MKEASITNNQIFNDNKPAISILLETKSSKEIRILMKKGQIMKKHQTPFPIVVEIFDGEIDFGVNDKILILKKGDLIALDGSVPHDLKANKESIIRLTLSKSDSLSRVKDIVK